jgi:hypothetical protein
MTDKKIGGRLAGFLIKAAEHQAKLGLEMNDLIWRVCYRDDLFADVTNASAQCRKLLEALKMVDHCVRDEHAEKQQAKNLVELRERKVP